jgi:hypothetical protein
MRSCVRSGTLAPCTRQRFDSEIETLGALESPAATVDRCLGRCPAVLGGIDDFNPSGWHVRDERDRWHQGGCG